MIDARIRSDPQVEKKRAERRYLEEAKCIKKPSPKSQPKSLSAKNIDNFIGGKSVAPVRGQYFDNLSPVTGKPLCQVARSTAEDIELALDAAHKAKDSWARPRRPSAP